MDEKTKNFINSISGMTVIKSQFLPKDALYIGTGDFSIKDRAYNTYPRKEVKLTVEDDEECNICNSELNRPHYCKDQEKMQFVKPFKRDRNQLISSLYGMAEEVSQIFKLNNKENLLKRIIVDCGDMRSTEIEERVVINGINFLI